MQKVKSFGKKTISVIVSSIILMLFSCKKDESSSSSTGGSNSGLATITTTAISNITSTSAEIGGNITSQGNSTIIERGVCWGLSAYPTIAGTHITDSGGTGAFTINLTGLQANTTYYLRAYATNSAGTVYGNQVNFTTLFNSFSIGDAYQGGIIAYIDSSGLHGLIATPIDISTGAIWCLNGGIYNVTGASGSGIGTGNQNTIDIMSGVGSGGIAAGLCSDLVFSGYADWYLPSKDELNQLYINRWDIGGFDLTAFYWSSTIDYTYIGAWSQNFASGSQTYNWASWCSFHVRAVRSF